MGVVVADESVAGDDAFGQDSTVGPTQPAVLTVARKTLTVVDTYICRTGSPGTFTLFETTVS
jgi:hypothetical protein